MPNRTFRFPNRPAARIRGVCLVFVGSAAWAVAAPTEDVAPEASTPARETVPAEGPWIDRFRDSLHRLTWRTARSIDDWAGEPYPEHVYREASGRLAVGLFWDEYDGWDPKVRFRVDLPTPQINERVNLFIGRFDRDEFVEDRGETQGTLPFRRRGGGEDETLAGFVYERPGSGGGNFSGSAGIRFKSGNLDPYVKASYRHRWEVGEGGMLTIRETLFYQASEKFGLTSRLDYEHFWNERLLLHTRNSATLSERHDGVRFNSQLTAIRALGDLRSIALQFEIDGDTTLDVPVREFGFKAVYRKSVFRPWLAVELLASLTWPRESLDEARKPSWGVGLAWEMTFGSEQLAADPVSL